MTRLCEDFYYQRSLSHLLPRLRPNFLPTSTAPAAWQGAIATLAIAHHGNRCRPAPPHLGQLSVQRMP